MKELVRRLLQRPLQSLRPQEIWNPELDKHIRGIAPETVAGTDKEQKAYGLVVKSALHLWNDSLDHSHRLLLDPLVYEIHNTGNYLHALVHRLEGDYENSRAWFEGLRHPIFPALNEKACLILRSHSRELTLVANEAKGLLMRMAEQSAWDPYLMLEAVEIQLNSREKQISINNLLEKIQRMEMVELLNYALGQIRRTGGKAT